MKIRIICSICSLIVIATSFSIFAVNTTTATVVNDSKEDMSYNLNQFNIRTIENVETTNYFGSDTYHASISPVSEFFDAQGNYNIVYEGLDKIYIAKLNSSMSLSSTITLTKSYPIYGGAICDGDGNYYIVFGQNDKTGSGQTITLRVSKYDSNGKLLTSINLKGEDTWDSSWGTQYPFDSGNCSLIINNNVLVFSYARQMYNGYQSNHVIYINCSTMKRINIVAPYSSHSFDQQVIATQSGSYLFVDHADAYDRGFIVSKVNKASDGTWKYNKFASFHFREGSNRSFGYNETFAQLGGIDELSTGYVLVGSSEKTLSYSVAPTNQYYCGHSEARNLFVQILKKDFEKYTGGSKYVTTGSVRAATGTPTVNAKTPLWLEKGTADYGIKWLTAYTNDYFVANPKVIATEAGKIIILWEKMKYGKENYDEFINTNLMVLSNTGEILIAPVVLLNVRLTSNEVPVYKNGSIYWTTSTGSSKAITVNRLDVNITSQKSAETKRIVSFNTFGGSAIPQVTAPIGATIIAPVSPVKNGYTFGGWFEDSSFSNNWNFQLDKVINNVTLYAKWVRGFSIPTGVKSIPNSYNSIRVSWNAVSNATGYIIYRYYPSTKLYEKIKVTSATSYINTGLLSNQKYYYKIRAYLTVNSSNLCSGYSATASCSTLLSVPGGFTVSRLNDSGITLSWKNVVGATAYEIYRSSSSGGTFNLIKTTAAANFDNTYLTNDQTYYYKIRAISTLNGQKVCGSFTLVKSVAI